MTITVDIEEEMNLLFIDIYGNFGKIDRMKLIKRVKKADRHLKPNAGLLINLKIPNEFDVYNAEDDLSRIVDNICYIGIVRPGERLFLEIRDKNDLILLTLTTFKHRDYALDWIKELVSENFVQN